MFIRFSALSDIKFGLISFYKTGSGVVSSSNLFMAPADQNFHGVQIQGFTQYKTGCIKTL